MQDLKMLKWATSFATVVWCATFMHHVFTWVSAPTELIARSLTQTVLAGFLLQNKMHQCNEKVRPAKTYGV